MNKYIFDSVPSQNLEFQCLMAWSFCFQLFEVWDGCSFFDIDRIVDNHCLNFLFITEFPALFTLLWNVLWPMSINEEKFDWCQWILWKESLNSQSRQVHQNQQLPLIVRYVVLFKKKLAGPCHFGHQVLCQNLYCI